MSTLYVVCGLLVAGCGPLDRDLVCGDGAVETVSALEPVDELGYLPYAHAHNDYEHARPLLDALELGVTSVEVDVWYTRGRFRVGHMPWDNVGNLRALYLEPIADRVRARGSVHGDGRPFTLWIDLKNDPDGLVEDLHELLDDYGDVLVAFADDVVIDAPVTVVLTGNARAKKSFVQRSPARATRDSNEWHPNGPAADRRWRYYALDWAKYVGWNGEGEPTEEMRTRVACISGGARRLGRRLRFYNLPEREAAWSLLVDSGVSFIGSDELEPLTSFLRVY